MRPLIALVAMVLGLFSAAAPVQAYVNGPRMEWMETFQASSESNYMETLSVDAAGNIYATGRWSSVRSIIALEKRSWCSATWTGPVKLIMVFPHFPILTPCVRRLAQGYAPQDATFQILDGPIWTSDNQFNIWYVRKERCASILRPPLCHHAVTRSPTPSLATPFLHMAKACQV